MRPPAADATSGVFQQKNDVPSPKDAEGRSFVIHDTLVLPLATLWPFLFQCAIWPIVRPSLRFFGHLCVRGLERLDTLPRGVIFAANHSSELDAVILPASLPFLSRFMPIFYASRERAFYDGSGWRQRLYGGFLFKLWGAYPVFAGARDYGLSLRTHLALLARSQSVYVFPEGRKTRDGAIGEGKGGVAYLAWRGNAPIVPVLIRGTFRMAPADFFSRRRSLSISFGVPLFPHELFSSPDPSPDDFKKATAVVLSRIRALGE